MQLVLFDSAVRFQLLPFTHTRAIADIRCGIWTQRERWEHLLALASDTLTEKYLQQVYAPRQQAETFLYVNAAVLASTTLVEAVKSLPSNAVLVSNNLLIAFRSDRFIEDYNFFNQIPEAAQQINFEEPIKSLQHIWDIFSFNEAAIATDFSIITKNRKSAPLPSYVTAIAPEHIFVEEGAQLGPCIINAQSGSVYIGKDAEIMEGVMIRGPLALCEHAALKMGAKIYGATTIGPGSKVGGEVGNSVFFANSNKGHDGYIGNAVIGEWCNLGADTNSSNLKNNYAEISIWNEYEQKLAKTGLQFCGLMMGDHSKCGINTMFNTATVVGVSCNIYGGGFQQKFIPSFSWGDAQELTTYHLDKALDTANRMMARRGKSLSDAEKAMMQYVFDNTKALRNSE